jgi:hypothetical protein
MNNAVLIGVLQDEQNPLFSKRKLAIGIYMDFGIAIAGERPGMSQAAALFIWDRGI